MKHLRAMSPASGCALVFKPTCLALLPSLLLWPASRRFPVLDLLRLALLDPAVASAMIASGTEATSVVQLVIAHGLASEAGDVNHMMALRFCCNFVASAPPSLLLAEGASIIALVLEAAAVAEVHAAARDGTRLALATYLLNVATLLSSHAAKCAEKTPVVCALQQFLTAAHSNVEVR